MECSECCQLCLNYLTIYNQNTVNYSLCSNFLCKNVIINICKENLDAEKHVYNIITHGCLTPQLKICASIIIYAPQLFKNSSKSIVNEIYSAFSQSTKQFVTLCKHQAVVQKLRMELSLIKKHEEYLFLNIFDQLLSKLNVADMSFVEYRSTFNCKACNLLYTKSYQGNTILFPYKPLAFPKFSNNKIQYPISCLKCNDETEVELELIKSGDMLSMMFKNGLSGTVDFNQNLNLNPVVILELCDAQYKDYSLWIKLQSDTRLSSMSVR